MYDISNTSIEKKIVHRIGNKLREEVLLTSDDEIPPNEAVDNILLMNYLKPILNTTEIFELFHESNIELNEIHHFTKKIFNNSDEFVNSSKDIAKSLYSCSTHPNILLGELIVILYNDFRINNKKYKAIGLYKTELKDDYLDIEENGHNFILKNKKGISINKIQKGALILEDGNIFAIDSLNQRTKYWYNDFLKIKFKKTPENNAYLLKKVIKEVASKVEDPLEKIKFNDALNFNLNKSEEISIKEIKDISKKFINDEVFEEIKENISIKENIELIDSDIASTPSLNKLTKSFRKKLNIKNLVDLTLKSENHFIEDIKTDVSENEILITFKIITKQ